MPKISVIVPVYNTEKYLYRCIDSILAQTFTDFELLLINDGSKDNSGKICDEYAAKDSRIKSVHIPNSGANNARLKGIQESIGEYVMFVDSDDVVSNNYFQLFYNEIYESDVDVVIRTEKYKKGIVTKQRFISDLSDSRVSVRLVDKIIRRKTLLYAYKQLPRDIVIGEDYIQSLFIAIHCSYAKYFINNKVKYYYTINNHSISHTNNCTYSYEKRFYSILESFSEFSVHKTRDILLMSKINGLIKVIMTGFKIDYNDSYFIQCKENWKKQNVKTIESYLLFWVRNNFFCRKLILAKRYLQIGLRTLREHKYIRFISKNSSNN